MILPTKHLGINESIMGGGGAILEQLKHPVTVSSLWSKIKKDTRIGNYHRFSLVLSFLFMLDVIVFRNGLIVRKKNVIA